MNSIEDYVQSILESCSDNIEKEGLHSNLLDNVEAYVSDKAALLVREDLVALIEDVVRAIKSLNPAFSAVPVSIITVNVIEHLSEERDSSG